MCWLIPCVVLEFWDFLFALQSPSFFQLVKLLHYFDLAWYFLSLISNNRSIHRRFSLFIPISKHFTLDLLHVFVLFFCIFIQLFVFILCFPTALLFLHSIQLFLPLSSINLFFLFLVVLNFSEYIYFALFIFVDVVSSSRSQLRTFYSFVEQEHL